MLTLFLVDPVQYKRELRKSCKIFFVDIIEDDLNDVLELFSIDSLLLHLFKQEALVAKLEQEVVQLRQLNYQRHVLARLQDYVQVVQKLGLEVGLRDPFEENAENRGHMNLGVRDEACLETDSKATLKQAIIECIEVLFVGTFDARWRFV